MGTFESLKPERASLPDTARIVITGWGMLTPLGLDTQTSWQRMLRGEDGITRVSAFDTSPLDVHRAGQIEGFVPDKWLPQEHIDTCGRASQLAVAAASQAIDHAGLDLASLDPFRCGVSFGTTMGEPDVFDPLLEKSLHTGPTSITAREWRKLPGHTISNNVAGMVGWRGPNILLPTACAAGNYAIGYASDLLRQGQVDVMLAGGSDALSRIAFVGFHKLRAMSPDHVRPFDRDRKGMMIGEGAAALVLERLSDAKARGATIQAELLSYGLGCDAHKMSIPHPEGRGGRIALLQALTKAKISPQDINYISAHGTGTQENDKIETAIIKQVLQEHAYTCPISSIKSMLGHCMGASSAIEAIVTGLALREGWLPPTIHYETPDPACDLDYIPNEARQANIEIAASHAYAFGGNTSVLLLKAWREQAEGSADGH